MKRSVFTSLYSRVSRSPSLPPITAQKGGHQGTARLDLVEATVSDLQKALQTRLVTSEQLVEMYLARIAAYDDAGPRLNSFLTVNPNALRRGARGSIAARHPRQRAQSALRHPGAAQGQRRHRRHADHRRLGGARRIDSSRRCVHHEEAARCGRDHPRQSDADRVRQLPHQRHADRLQLARRLWIQSVRPASIPSAPAATAARCCQPGGSSSGSGIAVAANLVAVAVGTETSGSILSPASANMDVGIKPTVGLISRDGIIPITADQDTAGPITRTVTDAAILLGVLAGHDPDDPATDACLTPGNCFSDYTRFLDKKALAGRAHRGAAVPGESRRHHERGNRGASRAGRRGGAGAGTRSAVAGLPSRTCFLRSSRGRPRAARARCSTASSAI